MKRQCRTCWMPRRHRWFPQVRSATARPPAAPGRRRELLPLSRAEGTPTCLCNGPAAITRPPSIDMRPPERAAVRPWLADLIAGLAVAGLLLPEAVAYASIAGLPPRHGVVALLAGLLFYGLVGRSRFAIVSATSSSAAVLAAATAAMAPGDGSLKLAVASGLVLFTGLGFLGAGLARMGSIT